MKNKTDIFSFKFTAILKNQCSLSLRGTNFLFALGKWFSDQNVNAVGKFLK